MLLLETAMLPENKNFEEFMDFRDMIQGDSLDDRMEMVQLLQDQEPVLHMAKPVMNRALSGQVTSEEALKDIEKSMKDKKIASPGDSLAEVFYESYITETAGLGKKTAEKIKKDVENKLSGGLVSLPVVEAGIGGWLGDLAVDFGKSFLGDVAGEALGGIAESFGLGGVADALGTSAGKGLVRAGTSALFDYGAKELFDYGQGTSIPSFGIDWGLGTLAEYASRPEEERTFFGTTFLDEEEEEKKRAILAARIRQAEARTGEFDKTRRDAFIKDFPNVQPPTKVITSTGGPPKKDFLTRLANYSRVQDAVADPTSEAGLKQLAARGIEPAGRALFRLASQAEGPQPQGIAQQQQIQPSRFVPRLSREVGGLRGITVPAKVDRNELNQRQLADLSKKGFAIHKGKRITRQDLVGRTEYVRREKPVMAATGGPITNEEFVMSLMYPDQFSGMVGGDGHGMEDNVQMPIVSDGEQVATLAVSPKEYVVAAYTMAALGNGNADEGAKIMDETIKSIRRTAYGTSKQPNEINGTKTLRSGLSSLG